MNAQRSACPHPLRLEAMELDNGETAVVAEMDVAPRATWVGALKRALAHAEGMEEISLQVEGHRIYFLGAFPGRGNAAHHIARALCQANERSPGRKSGETGHVPSWTGGPGAEERAGHAHGPG